MSTNLDPFIDRIAELRYLKYDSHASMPQPLSWEQYKAEDPSSAEALYLGEVRSEVLRALPKLRISRLLQHDSDECEHCGCVLQEGVCPWC